MENTATLTMGETGEIALPQSVRDRYKMTPSTPIRIVETRTGLLLVPLTDAPPSDALARELAEWQELGAQTWEQFPFEDADS